MVMRTGDVQILSFFALLRLLSLCQLGFRHPSEKSLAFEDGIA